MVSLIITVVIDLSVTIGVRFSYHLVRLGLREFFSEIHHGETQLAGANEPVVVLVENLESLLDVLLEISLYELLRHQVDKFFKVDGAAVCKNNRKKKYLITVSRSMLSPREKEFRVLVGLGQH